MTTPRNVRVYLEDMLNATQNALFFIKDLDYEHFSENEEKIYAVIHALEIIGEASKQIPASVRTTYPDIPWRAIAGTRDKLIHSYFNVQKELLWTTVTRDLPDLEKALITILEDL